MRTGPGTRLYAPFALAALVACDPVTEPRGPEPALPSLSAAASEIDGYVATVLPSFDRESEAFVVVDDGTVFGWITDSQGSERAARWAVGEHGSPSDPVLLGALPEPWDGASQAVRGTNTRGDVVVGTAGYDRTGPTVGWVWANGNMTLLDLPESAQLALAWGVGETGIITGRVRYVSDGQTVDYAAVWLPPYDSEVVLLPRLDGYPIQEARGITSMGVISGLVRSATDGFVQWQIDEDGRVLSGPTKLAVGDGFLLRNIGELDAVGHFAFEVASLIRLDAPQRIDLGMLDGHTFSAAHRATERAPDGSLRIAGYSEPVRAASADGRAVLWSVGATGAVTGPADLGLPPAMSVRHQRSNRFVDAGFVGARAYWVNAQGWVAGWSLREDGTGFATLWRPGQDEVGDENCERRHPRTGECR
jgi:hypothetical protein